MYHEGTPDLDKLQRAIGDSLSGVVIADDKQIAVWQAHKYFTADAERVEIEIQPLLATA